MLNNRRGQMETEVCAISRNGGGVKVIMRKRNPMGIRTDRKIVTFLFSIVLLLSIPARGFAELPVPNWLPGFPLVAGPQLILMWTPVIGAEKYRIYQDGKPVTEVIAFQHVLPLPAEGEHSYHVVAIDKNGKESPPGKTFKYAVVKLEKPKNVSVLVRGERISLRWDASKGAIIYDIQRGAAPGGPFQLVGSTQDQTFLDPGAKVGESYYYRVASKDATGVASDFSEPVIGRIEKVVETAAAKVKIIKAKLAWVVKDIPGVGASIYLSDTSLLSVSPDGALGPTLQIVEKPGTPEEKRTVIPAPPSPEGETIKVRFSGVGLSRGGSVLVTNGLAPMIYRVDTADKQIVDSIRIEALPKTQIPYSFAGVAEGPGGELYVAEQTNSTVLVIRNGKIVSTIGAKGTKPGELVTPAYVLVHDGRLYVTDSILNTITVFGLDGKFIRRIGASGGRDPGTFSRLTGIAIDGEKKWIFAGDWATSQIQVLDLEGKFVATLSNENGTAGLKTTPAGIAVRNDSLLVSWANGSRVQEFRFLGPPVEQ
jgi:hypothetical protein